MRRSALSVGLSALLFASPTLTGCDGDDTDGVAASDSGTPSDAASAGDATTTKTSDAGHDAAPSSTDDAGDAAPSEETDAGPDATTPYLLTSYEFNGYSTIEYGAFDLTHGKSVGHIDYSAGGAGGVHVSARAPWVLEQGLDLVLRMDPAKPWEPTASWSTKTEGADAASFAYAYTDPSAIAETATDAYVTLYNRNQVLILDTTTTPDAGTAAHAVDISAFLQSGDEDGSVEATAAFYDDSTKRVWVVLQSIDEYDYVDDGIGCVAGLTSRVIAIDTTTNLLVPSLVYPLSGYNPVSVAFDAANHRLIMMNAGCVNVFPDGGFESISGRTIEAMNLGTGVTTKLYDGSSQEYPGGFIYIDEHHAFVTYGTTYAWDPTLTTLGAGVTSTPDSFTWDGKGLLGPKTSYNTDGGIGSIDVVEVDPTTGVSTTLGSTPVSQPDPDGFWTSVTAWSNP